MDDKTPPPDYRVTHRGRQQAWFGYKRHIKRVLSTRLLHPLVRIGARLSPSMARSGRLPAPASLTESNGIALGQTFVMLDPARCVIAKELYWGRGKRPALRDALALELFCTRVKDADVVVDAGAYTGLFTLASASVNERVEIFAYEIIPEVFKGLFDNCVRNDLLPRVHLRLAGLGGTRGVIRVPAHFGGSAFPDFLSVNTPFNAGTAVPVVTLDAELANLEATSRVVVKIDVEGTEAQVLAGGAATLKKFRPDLLCEILEGADAKPIEALLTPHGYRFFKITDRITEAEHVIPDPQSRDWFFTCDSTFSAVR